MPQHLELEQLRTLGVNGALQGHLIAEPDGGGGFTVRLVKDNRSAAVDPTGNDDDTQGYAPGSLWVNTTAHRVWWCSLATTGAADWHQVGAIDIPGTGPGGGTADLANSLSLRPGHHSLGDILRYGPEGGLTSSVIQYTRIFLTSGTITDRMETFISSGGLATRSFRLGLYDQATPLAVAGTPNNLVASIPATPTGGISNAYVKVNLSGGPYTAPGDGYYWVALVADSAALKFPVTPQVYRVGFLAQQYYESTTGTALPATATPILPSVASALAYAASVDQGA